MILGIDPGPEKSAYAVWLGDSKSGYVVESGYEDNHQLMCLLHHMKYQYAAIEKVASFGMPVGALVFDTCIWTGRFIEAIRRSRVIAVKLITRNEVMLNFCNTKRAKKANVNQAMMDRFGGKGTKKKPGPFYSVKDHIWDACAVAITHGDLHVNTSKIIQTA